MILISYSEGTKALNSKRCFEQKIYRSSFNAAEQHIGV